MADGFDVATLIPHFQDITRELEAINQNDKKSQKEGVTEDTSLIVKAQKLLETLPEDMKKLVDNVLNSSKDLKDLKDNLSKTIEDAVEKGQGKEATGGLFGKAAGAGGPGAGGPIKLKTKINPKPTDFANMDGAFGMGPLLIYWKLDEIQKSLSTSKGKDKDKKGPTGLGNIFKGILEGAAGIAFLAVALLLFAGALVVFGLINWDSAVSGMFAFTFFVLGSIVLAKIAGKAKKDFVEFGLGIALMTVGFILFSIAVIIAAKATPYVIMAIPTLALFILFIFGATAVATMLKAQMQSFVTFALGSLLLAAGIIAFSLALFAATWAKPYALSAVPVIFFFLVFIYGMASIATLMKTQMQSFVTFALGSLLLTAGIIVFAGALFAAAWSLKFLLPALPVLFFYLVFLLGMTAIALYAGSMIPFLVPFALASLLLAASLAVFAAAVLIAGLVGKKIMDDDLLGAVAAMVLLYVGFIALAVLGAMAAPLMIYFAAGTIMLSFALMLFGVALLVIEKTYTKEALELAKTAIQEMKWIFLWTALAGLCAIPGIVGATLIAAFALIFVPAILGISKALKALRDLGVDEVTVDKNGKVTHSNPYVKAISVISGVIGAVTDIDIPVLKLLKFAAGIIPLGLAFASIGTIADSLKKLEKLEVNKAALDLIFEKLKEIMATMVAQAKTMNEDAQQAAQVLGQAIVPVSEAIRNIAETMVILSKIDDKQTQDAKDRINAIFNGVFLDEKYGLFKQISSVGETTRKQRRSLEALPELTDTIKKIANLVLDLEKVNVANGIANTQKMNEMFLLFNQTFTNINAKALGDSVKKFADGVNAFKEANLKTFTSAIEKISALGDISNTLSPLLKLADAMKPLEAVAKALERMAAAIQAIGRERNAIKSIMDLTGGEKVAAEQRMGINNSQSQMAAQMDLQRENNSKIDQLIALMNKTEQLLEKLDKDGIATRATPKPLMISHEEIAATTNPGFLEGLRSRAAATSERIRASLSGGAAATE